MFRRIWLVFCLFYCQSVWANGYEIIQQDEVNYAFFQAEARNVSLHWKDSKQNAYQYLDSLKKALEPKYKIKMLMNAGIYGKDNQPAGLWIENGKILHPLNLRKGKGNFHIQPNGVFLIDKQKAYILTTEQYRRSKFKPAFAVQSGPMLVINGKINPQFSPTLQSHYKRNAVCITKDARLYFVMTTSGSPNLYQLSQALLQKKCHNALYLDGNISSWYIPSEFSAFHWIAFVGMVAVTESE